MRTNFFRRAIVACLLIFGTSLINTADAGLCIKHRQDVIECEGSYTLDLGIFEITDTYKSVQKVCYCGDNWICTYNLFCYPIPL